MDGYGYGFLFSSNIGRFTDIIYLVGWLPESPDQIIINIKKKKKNLINYPLHLWLPTFPTSLFSFFLSFYILSFSLPTRDSPLSPLSPLPSFHFFSHFIFSLSLSLRSLGIKRRRWRSDHHGWGQWHEQLAKGGDRSSWGVLGRVLKQSNLTLLCHRLPHSFRSLTLNCHHHSPIHNNTQAVARRLFQIESLRHLAFHSNWFGNLLWFLFIFFFFLFDRFWFGNLWLWFGKYLELFFAVLEICSYLGICGFDLVKI